MKLLSESYDMKDTFTRDDFFRIMESWLSRATVTKPLGEQLSSSPSKEDFHGEAKYCRLDTVSHAEDSGAAYTALRLEQDFKGTTWSTEVILEEKDGEKTVYIHISYAGETDRKMNVNPMHRAVIQELMASRQIKDPAVPFTTSYIEAGEEHKDWLASAMKPGYSDDVPVVVVSQCFGSYGYDVNVDQLAKDFYGIAHIVTADNDYTRSLRYDYNINTPYGGAVAIYQNGTLLKQFQKGRDSFYGNSLDSAVEERILYTVTSNSEKEAPTWESILSSIQSAKAAHLAELVSMFDDDNMDKDEKLRIAKERIEQLWKDNESLKSRNESLQAALDAGSESSKPSLLSSGKEKELYEGEQHDLVLTILQKHLATNATDGTRSKELLESILEENKLCGAGKKIFDEVSRILSKGGFLSPRDISDLERAGFTVVSDSTHYRILFQNNPKYSFTFSKTPSDFRTGKNAITDILTKLSVYK
ncbi:MAG: hypothetical protein LUE27_03100 [Clostridia bacterium]|nr:hypothetical protein [Clostridia bacterium]